MNTTVVRDAQIRRLAKAYFIAKRTVLDEGYAHEIDWQYSVSLDSLNESTFLREAAWVILSSGMRESVIRQKFVQISEAFLCWRSARAIMANAESCRVQALNHFRSPAKIGAILTVANHVDNEGFARVLEHVFEEGRDYLQKLPFIGPVTSFHLAKNIGISCAKPDRHLVRIANRLGYNCVQQLCGEIAEATDEPISVVDLVLWRFATRHLDYVDRFSRLFVNSDGRA